MSKLQCPMNVQVPMSKMRRRCGWIPRGFFAFGIWALGIYWALGFGHWEFLLADEPRPNVLVVVGAEGTEEFRTLTVNRSRLEQLAKDTGGEVIAADDLDQFVSSLPNRKIPIVESWIFPLWHQSSVFLLAIGCLIGEWGLRRWRGMP